MTLSGGSPRWVLNSASIEYIAKRLTARDAPPLLPERFVDEQLARYLEHMVSQFDQLPTYRDPAYRRYAEPYGEAGGSVQMISHRDESGSVIVDGLRIVWRFPGGSAG